MITLTFIGALLCLAIGFIYMYAGDFVWDLTSSYYEFTHGFHLERTEA